MTKRAGRSSAQQASTERTSQWAEKLRSTSEARAARIVVEPLVDPDAVAGLNHSAAPGEEPAVTEAKPARPATRTPGAGNAAAAVARPVEVPKSAGPLRRPLAGPEGRLENSGEPIRKLTLEIPPALIDALSRWELDEARRTGKRVYRERLVDLAMSRLPDDVDAIIAKARSLPEELRTADPEQLGTRVRDSVHLRLKLLGPELRVRRAQGVYLRHIYAAAIYDMLLALGVAVPLEDRPAASSGGGVAV